MDVRHSICNRIAKAYKDGHNLGRHLRMLPVIVMLSLVGLIPNSVGPAYAGRPTERRETLDLGGLWHARLDATNRGEQEGYFEPSFNTDDWRQVHVPASFANVAPEIDRYEGIGWFRRTFRVPGRWRGRHVVLHFEGVNNQSKVWVNGRPVGENADAFLSFELFVGQAIRFDEDNVIVMRVDNTRRRDVIPGGREGWHPFGGILREVALRATDPLRIETIKISAEPGDKAGVMRLQTVIANAYDRQRTGQIEVRIFDQNNTACAHFTLGPIEVGANQQEPVEITKGVADVQAWSPAHPVLYTADLQLVGEERIVDRTRVRFGFRRIEAGNERLYLNGEPVFLTGFNRHEDSPRTDMCPDHELTRKELLMMKEMGCNFIRLCHYPQHPRTIAMCDEIGLLVMCEIPLYMWPGLAEGLENYRGTVESARSQLKKMIERDYNHPSVIFWSVSNEIHTQHPEVRGTNVMLVQQAKRTDPTRLAVHVSDHWQPYHDWADSFGEDDVICLNGYPHPKEGPAWWSTHLEELHKAYPGKPILITEFGGEAGEDCQWQIARLKSGFAGTTAAYVCGVAIWCWADHAWDKTWLEPPLSPYGLFTRDRRARPSVDVARQGFLERQQSFQMQTK